MCDSETVELRQRAHCRRFSGFNDMLPDNEAPSWATRQPDRAPKVVATSAQSAEQRYYSRLGLPVPSSDDDSLRPVLSAVEDDEPRYQLLLGVMVFAHRSKATLRLPTCCPALRSSAAASTRPCPTAPCSTRPHTARTMHTPRRSAAAVVAFRKGEKKSRLGAQWRRSRRAALITLFPWDLC